MKAFHSFQTLLETKTLDSGAAAYSCYNLLLLHKEGILYWLSRSELRQSHTQQQGLEVAVP